MLFSNTCSIHQLNKDEIYYYAMGWCWYFWTMFEWKKESEITMFLINVFSTNRWNSTCPFINFRRMWDRGFTITMNTDSKGKSLTRTASWESLAIRSKRWSFSKASYQKRHTIQLILMHTYVLSLYLIHTDLYQHTQSPSIRCISICTNEYR